MTGQAKHAISVPATEDLKGKEFHLVTLAGALAGAGAVAFPLENDMAQVGGEPCNLTIGGVSQVYYGGTVGAGAALAAGANGRAVAAAASAQIIGYATRAGVSGELGSMLVALNGVVPSGG